MAWVFELKKVRTFERRKDRKEGRKKVLGTVSSKAESSSSSLKAAEVTKEDTFRWEVILKEGWLVRRKKQAGSSLRDKMSFRLLYLECCQRTTCVISGWSVGPHACGGRVSRAIIMVPNSALQLQTVVVVLDYFGAYTEDIMKELERV